MIEEPVCPVWVAVCVLWDAIEVGVLLSPMTCAMELPELLAWVAVWALYSLQASGALMACEADEFIPAFGVLFCWVIVWVALVELSVCDAWAL